MRSRSCLALMLLIGLGLASPATARQPFRQDAFTIGFWVDPPLDQKADDRYREIAEAGFTIAIGNQAATTETIRRQLDLCRKHGLKALVQVPHQDLKMLVPDDPALLGYLWRDEPSAKDFNALASAVAAIGQARPGRLTFINLFPNYATSAQLGASSYDEHVRGFVDTVHPDILCMDHYPFFRPDKDDGRNGYCENLAVMRKHSLRAGIPFWNFFNTMPYGDHTDPTDAQLRWQIYASLAYGAKGVLYFCYYTPLSEEFPKGGAIITRDNRRTRHYDQAKRLNAELKNLGPTLMRLTSTAVVRLKPGDDPAAALQKRTIKKITWAKSDPEPDLLLGEFRHADGRRAVLLQNYHFAYSGWPTVEFDAPLAQVMEVDKTDGRERPVLDDSPDQVGLQLSLDAGEGRLFLLPAQTKKP